ncbi:MAG: hypothetical protein DMG60_22625, partial [Acidobacteria bacterium]
QNETIEILVPLPDAVYDPNILVKEQASPEFQAEVDAGTLARNITLQHRVVIQKEANALAPLLNQPKIDSEAGLNADEVAVLKGTSVFTPLQSEAFGTTLKGTDYVSDDLQFLKDTAAAAPYTVTANSVTIPLFNDDGWLDLTTNGIEHFIDRINAKLNRANDLLDLAFLTAQTDIYRYRQNVLNTTAASRLAVSPVLANIASGETAAATAQNIRDYLSSIQAQSTTPALTTTTTTTTTPRPGATSRAFIRNINPQSIPTFINTQRTSLVESVSIAGLPAKTMAAAGAVLEGVTATPARLGGLTGTAAKPTDITQQSPIVGAQLDLRTLTVAERLAPSRRSTRLSSSTPTRMSPRCFLPACTWWSKTLSSCGPLKRAFSSIVIFLRWPPQHSAAFSKT